MQIMNDPKWMSYTRNQTRIENDENKIQDLSEDLIKVCKDALELLWNGSVKFLYFTIPLFLSQDALEH